MEGQGCIESIRLALIGMDGDMDGYGGTCATMKGTSEERRDPAYIFIVIAWLNGVCMS